VLDAFGDDGTSILASLPEGRYASRPLGVAGVAVEGVDGLGLSVWKDPRAFGDGCAGSSAPATGDSGADAFVDAVRRTDGIRVVSADAAEVGTLPVSATRLVIEGDNSAACTSPAAWQAMADIGSTGYRETVARGERREVFAFDLARGTYLVEVRGAAAATQASILGSIFETESLRDAFYLPPDRP
jgi:hypothetical protein